MRALEDFSERVENHNGVDTGCDGVLEDNGDDGVQGFLPVKQGGCEEEVREELVGSDSEPEPGPEEEEEAEGADGQQQGIGTHIEEIASEES